MVGYGATICTIAAFAPQLGKAWRTRSTNDISLTMFLVRVTGIGLWLTLSPTQPPCASRAILFLKLKYKQLRTSAELGKHRKPFRATAISERQPALSTRLCRERHREPPTWGIAAFFEARFPSSGFWPEVPQVPLQLAFPVTRPPLLVSL